MGIIFDMDGTLINNLPYHLRAFRIFFEKYKLDITDEQFLQYSNGKTNDDIMRWLFGSGINQEQVNTYMHEKESLYRQMYAPHLALAQGLQPLLDQLLQRGVPMAVGSSAPDENIDFVLDGLQLRPYFKAVINSSQITHGKPHPEVFLTAAKALGCPPAECVVIEDALVGIEAGKRAGMQVVAIASIMAPEALAAADLVIRNFEELTVEQLIQMSKTKHHQI